MAGWKLQQVLTGNYIDRCRHVCEYNVYTDRNYDFLFPESYLITIQYSKVKYSKFRITVYKGLILTFKQDLVCSIKLQFGFSSKLTEDFGHLISFHLILIKASHCEVIIKNI